MTVAPSTATRTLDDYRASITRAADERAEAMAAKVTTMVLAADAYPVQRKQVAAVLGDGSALTRAIALAVERGEVVSLRSGPARTGLYPPEHDSLTP